MTGPPPDLASRLLHRDAMMLILDKPAGLPVHAGPKGGPNLAAMLGALRFGLPNPPALAHRLDRDTSGCLVLGRHRKATARLGELFASGGARKTYLAVLHGHLPEPEGVVDAHLAKRGTDKRSWWMKVDGGGQPALTRWRVLGTAPGFTAVALSPETGRTHQLRVHTAHLGHPIVGDAVYGRREDAVRMHLHAWRIALPFQPRKPPVEAEAPPPADMHELLNRCGVAVAPAPAGSAISPEISS